MDDNNSPGVTNHPSSGFMGNGVMGLGPLGGNVLPNQQQNPGLSDPNQNLGGHGTIYDNAVGNQGKTQSKIPWNLSFSSDFAFLLS